MYYLIKRYMDNLTKEKVNNFALSKKIFLSEDELSFTFLFIKKNWEQIISNPSALIFDRYKDKYSEENFNKIDLLIKEYYAKYHSIL